MIKFHTRKKHKASRKKGDQVNNVKEYRAEESRRSRVVVKYHRIRTLSRNKVGVEVEQRKEGAGVARREKGQKGKKGKKMSGPNYVQQSQSTPLPLRKATFTVTLPPLYLRPIAGYSFSHRSSAF